jgi:hypothetical protein
MKFDVERLKQEIKTQAAGCREAKKKRREAERAVAASADPPYANWSHTKRVLDLARSSAAEAAERMTLLCSIRAHMRGRLHAARERWANGTVTDRTMEDQAQMVTGWLEKYVLEDAVLTLEALAALPQPPDDER